MIINKTFKINLEGNDYVVGDLHGCYTQLMIELERVNFNSEVDRLFSVGDLIDRGPDSLKCLELLHQPWFECVQGNHESMMIETLFTDSRSTMWRYNGGKWADKVEIDKLYYWAEVLLDTVPICLTIETYKGLVGISHAQPPTKDWKYVLEGELTHEDILTAQWDRSMINAIEYEPTLNIDLTIHGHTPDANVINIANARFIDTGSFLKEFDVEGYPGVTIHKITDLF